MSVCRQWWLPLLGAAPHQLQLTGLVTAGSAVSQHYLQYALGAGEVCGQPGVEGGGAGEGGVQSLLSRPAPPRFQHVPVETCLQFSSVKSKNIIFPVLGVSSGLRLSDLVRVVADVVVGAEFEYEVAAMVGGDVHDDGDPGPRRVPPHDLNTVLTHQIRCPGASPGRWQTCRAAPRAGAGTRPRGRRTLRTSRRSPSTALPNPCNSRQKFSRPYSSMVSNLP